MPRKNARRVVATSVRHWPVRRLGVGLGLALCCLMTLPGSGFGQAGTMLGGWRCGEWNWFFYADGSMVRENLRPTKEGVNRAVYRYHHLAPGLIEFWPGRLSFSCHYLKDCNWRFHYTLAEPYLQLFGEDDQTEVCQRLPQAGA